jgi:hypothetical protein
MSDEDKGGNGNLVSDSSEEEEEEANEAISEPHLSPNPI